MFNIRPEKRWFEFGDVPLEDSPGFRMNAGGTVRDDASSSDLSTALPGGAMFNVQPERQLPGLHNFRPPEELVTGFRLSADGSMQDTSTPPARLYPDAGGNPFRSFYQPGTKAFTSVGDGSPPPYLAYSPGFSNGLGKVLPLGDGELSGTAVSSLSNAPFFSGRVAGGPPFVAPPPPFPFGRPDPTDEPRPSTTAFSYAANPVVSPLQPAFGASTPEDGSSKANTGLGNNAVLADWPASDGLRSASGQTADPNIVHVGNGDSITPTGNVQIGQPPEKPQSKLKKDPSPGVVVVLPDKSTIPDPQSPTGQLMAPTADLSEVAAAGRRAKEMLDELSVFPPAYLAYLAGTLGWNVGQGGTFDYQRVGNRITGYTHRQQFVKVSNLNVGLFAQQAGLTLEQTLIIAGEFARLRSSNADEKEPYGLNSTQREFITRGYKIGASGMFDQPPAR
ncbi:MAG: hypothetical protein HYX38_14235 [Rhodospirillales bacterium]|nr:hypothetical protein [Rhodospirillales bacterium]